MIEKIAKISVLILLITGLSACGGSSCSTAEDVAAKAEELTKKMQSLVASGDVSKIMALSGKMQEIQNMGNGSDPQAACEAMDNLMADM